MRQLLNQKHETLIIGNLFITHIISSNQEVLGRYSILKPCHLTFDTFENQQIFLGSERTTGINK